MPPSLDQMMRQLYGPTRSARFANPSPPQEDDSLLDSVAGNSLSALQFLGQALDKPGRSVRGLLAGKPEELLNLVPFSSTIGLTDEDGWLGDYLALTDDDNYTSGRDLLREAGLISRRDNWGNFAGGLAVEMATDPLSYLTLGSSGALSQAGRVASKAGALPRSAAGRVGGTLQSLLDEAAGVAAETGGREVDDLLARLARAHGGDLTPEVLSQPLAGMFGLGLPLRAPSYIPQPGPRSRAAAEFLDRNYDTLKYGDTGFYGGAIGGAYRKGRELLDSSLRGAGHVATQRALDTVPGLGGRSVRETIEGRQADTTMAMYGEQSALRRAGVNPLDPEIAPRLKMARESTWPGAPPTVEARQQMAQAMGKTLPELAAEEAFKDAGLRDDQINAIKPFLTRQADRFAEVLTEKEKLGFRRGELADETITYDPNLVRSEMLSQRPPGQHTTAPTGNPHDLRRAEGARNLPPTAQQPGGTMSVTAMLNDPELGKQLGNAVQSDLLDLPSERLAEVFREQAELNQVPGIDQLLDNAAAWQVRGMLQQMQRGEVPTLVQRPPKNPANKAARQAINHVYTHYLAWTPREGEENLRRMNQLLRQRRQLAESGGALDAADEEFLAAMQANLKQARTHASWVRNLPADAQYDLRTIDVSRDALNKSIQQVEMAKAIQRAVAYGGEFLDPATSAGRTQLEPRSGLVPALTVLDQAGMKNRNAAIRSLAETLHQVRPEVMTAEFGEGWLDVLRNEGDSAEILSWLDKWMVPESLARDLTKVMDFTHDPQSISGFLGWSDKMTSWLKSNLTSVWPAFAARNGQSLFWQDGVAGGFQNLEGMTFGWHNSKRLLKGEVIPGASEIPAVRAEWGRRMGDGAIEDATSVVAGPNRDRVAQAARQAFSRPLEADATLALMDAHAQFWSEQTGRPADEWFTKIADVRRADPSQVGSGALMQEGAAPLWHSKMEQLIEAKIPNRVSPDQLMATLRKAGVKQEELDRLTDLVSAEGAVDKQQLLDALREEGLPISETIKTGDQVKWGAHRTAGTESYREVLLQRPGESVFTADQGSHWDEPNVMAHIRMADFTGPDGKRYLRVEEIQSDWHQAGRKQGYGTPEKPLDFAEWASRTYGLDADEIARHVRENSQLMEEWRSAVRTVPPLPDAPLKKTWHEAALKRVLREAGDGDYDGIIWPSGREIAERVGGHISGQQQFYDSILPSALRKLGKSEGISYRPPPVAQGNEWDALKSAKETLSEDAYDFLDRHQDLAYDYERIGQPFSQFLEEAARDEPIPAAIREELMQAAGGSGRGNAWDRLLGSQEQLSPAARDWLDNAEFLIDSARQSGRSVEEVLSDAARYEGLPQRVIDELNAAASDSVSMLDKSHVFELPQTARQNLRGQSQPLWQTGEQGPRGAVEFAQDGRAVISAFQARDLSTFAHETGHVFRRSLAEASPGLLRQAEDALGVQGGVWTRAAEEAWATGFERYLRDGHAPTRALQQAFAAFKRWLTKVYRSLTGTPLEQQVSPELKSVFDQMLGGNASSLSPGQFTDEEATQIVREMFAAEKVSPVGFGDAMDRPNVTAAADAGLTGGLDDLSQGTLDAELPNLFQGQGPLGAAGNYAATPLREIRERGIVGGPLNMAQTWQVRGGFQKEASNFSQNPLVQAGEKLNTYIEQLGRGATFLRKLREGAEPAVAAMESKAAHVDYSRLTPFERKVMKRIVPFYTFTRHMAPYQLKEILTRPGGEVATLVKQSGRSAMEDGFVPDQVVGSFELGEDVDSGTTEFLTIDLPHKVLDDMFTVGNSPLDTIQKSGASLLSQTHPALKAPLETVTGQSFFQRGRPLTDLHSRTGTNNVLVDQVLMNSPWSRAITTLGQITDPRKEAGDKALNLLTGVRVSDIDLDKARDWAARDNAMQMLQESGARTFTKPYIPGGAPNERQQELLQLLNDLRTRRADP